MYQHNKLEYRSPVVTAATISAIRLFPREIDEGHTYDFHDQ